ncbi:hypothetical protein C8R46DRAFT_1088163 [Mycena filopes]|nr:hypothetical protein C8R46DRAFT_1088163 [Mycena filopes]
MLNGYAEPYTSQRIPSSLLSTEYRRETGFGLRKGCVVKSKFQKPVLNWQAVISENQILVHVSMISLRSIHHSRNDWRWPASGGHKLGSEPAHNLVPRSAQVPRMFFLKNLGPRLPPELERLIFEVAALSYRVGIPTLMLVVWRIKEWIEPLRYRDLYIAYTFKDDLHGFPWIQREVLLAAIESRPPTLFRSVQHLVFDDSLTHDYTPWPSAALNTIFGACSRITTLYSAIDLNGSLDALGSLQGLRRLTINLQKLFHPRPIDFAHPMFQNITHLELDDDDEQHTVNLEATYSSIVTLPNLSHIAFQGRASLCRALEPLFRGHGARLRCFVFLAVWMGAEITAMLLPGPHLPQFVHIDQAYLLGDGRRAGTDYYWALAEEFLDAKRDGRVEGSVYKIWEREPPWRT